MDSEFHPHRFHPTKFALDPYDLLIEMNPAVARFIGTCKCTNKKHKNHPGKDCLLVIERNCQPNDKGYQCFECKKARRTEREMNYTQNGYKLRNHV